MNIYTKLPKVLLVLSLIITFSSCKQQAIEFSTVQNEDLLDRTKKGDLPDDEIIDTEVEVTLASCLQAQSNGSIMTFTAPVFFPAAIECEFNESGSNANELNPIGNGPRKNQKIRARIEQQYQVSLPELGKICDVDFNFPAQSMQYDDEIFLLLNNFVLMSSTNYAKNSGSTHYLNGLNVDSRGLQTYKWLGDSSLYNLYYSHAVTPRYCLGVAQLDYVQSCALPATEQFGQIKLNIPQENIVQLGIVSELLNQSSGQQTNLNFGFVSIGDNDNGDCEHSAFSFDIEVKYYIPSND
jgi:hypothetical protein